MTKFCVWTLLVMGLIVDNDVYSMTSSRKRRSDDGNVLTPVVTQHSQELAELKAELTSMKAELTSMKVRTAELENIVAFTVRFSRGDVTGLGLHQPVVFDVVEYNAGDGYDKNTGVFTAPSPGAYVFALSLQRHGSDEDTIKMTINKGATILAVAEAGYSPFEHGTMVVTAHLNQGDVISVQTIHGSTVYGSLSTYFTGFRISPF